VYVAAPLASIRDYVGGIQRGARYVYRVTAVGPNGETGWNTIHWAPPCISTPAMNFSVEGSTVRVWGSYNPCTSSTTIRNLDPSRFRVTSSYGFVKEGYSTDAKSYYFTIYGVAPGTHTFTVTALWWPDGVSTPASRQITVSY
jgi:hypothetical protein